MHNMVARSILDCCDEVECTGKFCLAFCMLACMLLTALAFTIGVDLAAMIIATEKTNNNHKCALLEAGDDLVMNPATF